MGFEESWILSDNVHDIGGDHGLVVLSPLHLCQAEEILDNSDEESLLDVLIYEDV